MRSQRSRPETPVTPAATAPPPSSRPPDELGAHVSSAGGLELAPGRALAIGASVLQLFTKTPSRWAEPRVAEEVVTAFARARVEAGVVTCVAHDSYLINLASPDTTLRRRSLASFRAELERCVRLGVAAVVTHPGNATDGDHASGIVRNGDALAEALEAVPGDTRVLLELTAGTGTSVGGSFVDLAALLEGVPGPLRARVGVCVDTCHAWAAGYDLRGDYEGVWMAFADVLAPERLELFHLNDSRHPRGSRRDRHAHIGEGTLGGEPFRRLLLDERFAAVPKILETPKDDDPVANDRRNLARLRGYRAGA
jgi:deoxyribonuclease-4